METTSIPDSLKFSEAPLGCLFTEKKVYLPPFSG